MRINEIIEKTVYTKPGEDPAGRSKYLSTYDIGVMDRGLEQGENTSIQYKGNIQPGPKDKKGQPTAVQHTDYYSHDKDPRIHGTRVTRELNQDDMFGVTKKTYMRDPETGNPSERPGHVTSQDMNSARLKRLKAHHLGIKA
jgi:hypothetical protein